VWGVAGSVSERAAIALSQ